MITITEARTIAAGWISPGAKGLTAFATGHRSWTPDALIDDVQDEIAAVKRYESPATWSISTDIAELNLLLDWARSI